MILYVIMIFNAIDAVDVSVFCPYSSDFRVLQLIIFVLISVRIRCNVVAFLKWCLDFELTDWINEYAQGEYYVPHNAAVGGKEVTIVTRGYALRLRHIGKLLGSRYRKRCLSRGCQRLETGRSQNNSERTIACQQLDSSYCPISGGNTAPQDVTSLQWINTPRSMHDPLTQPQSVSYTYCWGDKGTHGSGTRHIAF